MVTIVLDSVRNAITWSKLVALPTAWRAVHISSDMYELHMQTIYMNVQLVTYYIQDSAHLKHEKLQAKEIFNINIYIY